MSEVRIVVAGAAGRMGQALIRAISETPGAMLSGALEASGHPDLGQDSGLLAGLKPNGIVLSDDSMRIWRTLRRSSISPCRRFPPPCDAGGAVRIVHVIGTTGCSAEDEAKIGLPRATRSSSNPAI